MKLRLLPLVFLLATSAHAQSYTNIQVLDANRNTQTLCTLGVAGVQTYCQLLFGLNGSTAKPWSMDSSGNGNVNAVNLPIDLNGYLKAGLYDAVNGNAVNLQSGTAGSPVGGVVSVQGPGAGMTPFDISVYTSSQTPITASSGNVSNANAVATLAAASSKKTYIDGFLCTWVGATSAAVVNLTIVGAAGGTMTFPVVFPAGVTTAGAGLGRDFSKPIPSSATNTAIVVTLPAGGSGNTNAACSAWGFQQ